MFVLLYTVNVYVCIMACSASCCLHDTLMDPWNVCTGCGRKTWWFSKWNV